MANDQGSTHTVMPKKLAQALMEASMQHFAVGGPVQAQNRATIYNGDPSNPGPPIDSTTGQPFPGQGTATTTVTNPGQQPITSTPVTAGSAPSGVGGQLGVNSSYSANPANIYEQDFATPEQTTQYQQQAGWNSQTNLAQQLMNQSVGGGPNPAQNQLNQTTAQNISNQGSLMASQRGASSNPALIARQAAMQGANTQQQAVGQAATMNAQQQIAAEAQAANVENNMATQANNSMGIQQGAIAAQNTANINNTLGAENINAQTAAANSGNNSQILGGVLSSLPIAAAIYGGSSGGGGGGGGNTGTTTGTTNTGSANFKGGKIKSFGRVLRENGKQEMPQHFDTGGIAKYETPSSPNLNWRQTSGTNPYAGLGANIGKAYASMNTQKNNAAGSDGATGSGGVAPLGATSQEDQTAAWMQNPAGNDYSGQGPWGGGRDAPLTGATQEDSLAESNGGKIPFSRALLNGGTVPGKAEVDGDSPENDTQPAMLSPGEEVLPRSVTMAKDAPERAADFVRHLQERDGKRDKPGFGKVINAKKSLKERVEHLEKCMGGRI